MARPATKSSWARRTYLASSVAFAGALAALGAQMSAGADPSIKPTAAAPPRPTLIVTRKIVRTTVITKRVVHRAAPVVAAPVSAGSGYAPYTPPSSGGTTVTSAPVVRAPSAPAPVVRTASAPRPVAQAPAPAPAPVTRAS